jgi:tRNA 2-thiouridine synthesizing protein A
MDTDYETLDLRGLKCPLPALLARLHLKRAEAGAALLVLTDDPMAPIDVPHMCRIEGFDVIDVTRDGDAARMILRKP